MHIVVMKEIPVEFEFQGKRYKGVLSPVGGAAAKMYHLMIDSYYRGQLFLTHYNGKPLWRFTTQKAEYPELAEYFGKLVDAEE